MPHLESQFLTNKISQLHFTEFRSSTRKTLFDMTRNLTEKGNKKNNFLKNRINWFIIQRIFNLFHYFRG